MIAFDPIMADEEQKPKTLRELREERMQAGGLGIRCPKCGCPHLPGEQHTAQRTNAMGRRQSIRRQRECRNCGHVFMTMETVIW